MNRTSSLAIEGCVVGLGWLTVLLVRPYFLSSQSVLPLAFYIVMLMMIVSASVFFFYQCTHELESRSSRIELARYPGIFRVVQMPADDSIILMASNAVIAIGDFGWQSAPIDRGDDLIYLQGLNEDWNVVWYAAFEPHELEFVCRKPKNQLHRRTWQIDQTKCPFTVSSKIANIDTFGLPMAPIGRWIQGVFIPQKHSS